MKGAGGGFGSRPYPTMKLDSYRGIDALMTEPVRINSNPATVYCAVAFGGYPRSGGSESARQTGEQYTLRFRKVDYARPVPAVHDQIYTKNYGTLEVKQIRVEGDHYALRVTGQTAVRVEV